MSDKKPRAEHARPHEHSVQDRDPAHARHDASAEHAAHDDIGCLRAIEAFYAYLDGELDDPEAIEQFEHHMGHCRSCYSRTQMERMLTERMKASAKSKAPDALKARLRDLMKNF